MQPRPRVHGGAAARGSARPPTHPRAGSAGTRARSEPSGKTTTQVCEGKGLRV